MFSNPDINIPTAEEVSRIRALLALDNRTEDDWCVIKGILLERDMICVEPAVTDDKIRSVRHMLAHNGGLVVFLDVDSATSYMKELKPKGVRYIQYNIGTIPVYDACRIADEEGMELYIDPLTKDRLDGKFISYHDGQILAVMGAKLAFEALMQRIRAGEDI